MTRPKGTEEAIPPDFFLAGYPDEIHVAADRLRAIVKAAVPDVVERVRPGWKIVGYDLPLGRRTVYFAWVMPEAIHVHLGFPQGVFLADPDRRLEGAHLRLRTTRFVTFETGDAIPRQALIRLTKEAARVAAMSREERMSLAPDRDWAPDPDDLGHEPAEVPGRDLARGRRGARRAMTFTDDDLGRSAVGGAPIDE